MPIKLEQDYYLDHFNQLLDGIECRYDFLLDSGEKAYVANLRQLSPPAIRLYARLVNRKGPFFRVAKLSYSDIDINLAILELTERGFLENCIEMVQDGLDIFHCYTCQEWRLLLRGELPVSAKSKSDILSWWESWPQREDWLEKFLMTEKIVRVPEKNIWPYFRFLFFGEMTENLSGFAVRDLGIIVPDAQNDNNLQPHFKSRDEAGACYQISCLYQTFRKIRASLRAEELIQWWHTQNITRDGLNSKCWPIYDRLIDRLGKIMERGKSYDAALQLYATSPVAPNRERQARLLIKLKRHQEAVPLLRQMISSPSNSEELYVARQILARIEKKTRRTDARSYHASSPAVVLDYSQASVETVTLEYYAGEGWSGIHSENWLWCATFGLLFWDIIHDASHGGFHSPLQLGPSDLYNSEFYIVRRGAIENRLQWLENKEMTLAHICDVIERKKGFANPFVYWHEGLKDAVKVLLARLPHQGLAQILRHMAQDLKHRTRGFPDLFLWTDNDYQFIEVKSQNDTLAGHQHQWLEFFSAAGLRAGLLQVHPAVKAA